MCQTNVFKDPNLAIREEKHGYCLLFLSGLFYLVISVLLWFVSGGEYPHHCLSFKCFLHSFFSALPLDFFSAGFPVMKSPMFTIVLHENNFFEEPLVFVSFLYVDV